jgi:cholecystokinin A receptor
VPPTDYACAENTRPGMKSKHRFEVQRGIRQSNAAKSRASKQRAMKMLFAVVLEFFICWTPLYVVVTWEIMDYKSAESAMSSEFKSFVLLLSYVSPCCNPLTYCFFYRNFRQGFIAAFRSYRRKPIPRSKSEMSYSGRISVICFKDCR